MTDVPERIAREIEAYRDRARALGATCDQDHSCHSGYLIGLSEAAVIARNFDDDTPARAVRSRWPALTPEEADLILSFRDPADPDGVIREFTVADYLAELDRRGGEIWFRDPEGLVSLSPGAALPRLIQIARNRARRPLTDSSSTPSGGE